MAQPTMQEIDRVIAGYNLADEAANYERTIVCEMRQETGENYQMLWSTEYNGTFMPDN